SAGHGEPGDLGERSRLRTTLARLPGEGEAQVEVLLRRPEVGLSKSSVTSGEVGLGQQVSGNALTCLQRVTEPPPALRHQAAGAPETNEGAGEPQPELHLVCSDRPPERRANVAVLLVEPLEPARLVRLRP